MLLQIPMHDAFFMRGFERVSDLASDFQGLAQRDWSFLDSLRQRRPFHQFHHKVERSAGAADATCVSSARIRCVLSATVRVATQFSHVRFVSSPGRKTFSFYCWIDSR